MATVTPSWTDNVEVLAPWCLAANTVKRVTFDLRTKIGAQIQIGVGFSSGDDLTAPGVAVRIYRMLNNDGNSIQFASPYALFGSDIDPGLLLINNASGYSAGETSIAYDGAAGRTFLIADKVCFWGVDTVPSAGAIATPTVEFNTIHKVATPVVLDSPLKYAHADNELIGLANCWTAWLPGGATYAVVFDYSADADSDPVCCAASMQTYDSDGIA